MARKRPSGTKRFRERVRRERQEEKARRKASRRAAKENSPATSSDGDDVPGIEAEETDDVLTQERNVADEQPVSTAESHDREEGGEPRGPDDDSAGQAAAGSDGGGVLTVTRDASELLSKILARENLADGVAVRFSLADDGSFSLSLERKRPDDETFAHDGRTVLVMEPAVARRLENDTLDVEESPDGLGLMLTSRREAAGEAEA